jgi:hypothetical protein
MGKTYIAQNIKKTSDRINGLTGDIINPRTKQIITPVETEYSPPPATISLPDAPECPTLNENSKVDVCPVSTNPLSISDQIKQAKENLRQLEELKQLKIKELKAQAELLEKE